MIPIDLSLALGLYLVIGVGIISLLWLVNESRRRAADLTPKEGREWACGLCLHKYIDSIAEYFSRCPRCGNLNKK